MTKEYSPATDYEIEALETRSLEGGTYPLPCFIQSIVARIRQDARTITSLNGLVQGLRETIKKQGDDTASLKQKIHSMFVGLQWDSVRMAPTSPVSDAKGPERPETADDSQETNARRLDDQIRIAVSAEVAKYMAMTNEKLEYRLQTIGRQIDELQWKTDGHSDDCDSVEHDEDGERYDCNCHVSRHDISAPMSARELAEKALERCGDLQSQLAILSRQMVRLAGIDPAVQHTEPSVPVSVLRDLLRKLDCIGGRTWEVLPITTAAISDAIANAEKVVE